METEGILTEQGLIRLSLERINLLHKDIETRAHEMNELAAVAQRFREEGSDCVSEGTMVVKTSGGKGKKRAPEGSDRFSEGTMVVKTSGGKGKKRAPQLSAGSIDGGSVPKQLLFPRLPAAVAQESQLYRTEDVKESSSGAEGEHLRLLIQISGLTNPRHIEIVRELPEVS